MSISDQTVFDVIIAGAGPAGCVLASRLSERSDKRILLIEAGPDIAPGTEYAETLSPYPMARPELCWPGLFAEMGSKSSFGDSPRPYLQGYGVGGASNINGMGADRPQPGDLEEWRALGAEGWGWKDVLPYYKKLEHDLNFAGSPDHGADGPMPVRRLPRMRWGKFSTAVGNAAQRRGLAALEDYNTDFREGVGAAPTNCLEDGRVSTSMAYLTAEVRRRANLTILPRARVGRLGFVGQRAEGVHVQTEDGAKYLRGRQIIVSCGAIQSPALLMRSGIGPREHLEGLGIQVVRALPGVGENLQNHPYVVATVYLPPAALQPDDNPWMLQNWLRFSSNHPGCAANDMHIIPLNKCAWHELGRRVGAVAVSLFNAYSKGRIELSSTDPAIDPRIRFNMLSDTRDNERMVSGFRFVLELLTDPEVARLRRQLFLPSYRLVRGLAQRNSWNALKARIIAWILDLAPIRRALLAQATLDPEKLLADDAELRKFVSTHAQLQYHPCGTCRMGSPEDESTVVDSAARVLGVEALRVVDAAIFPTIIRGNTHFTVLMAAEKIADLVKEEWRQQSSDQSFLASHPSRATPATA
jgi:5-(hydroxymethyl)furfural/furfural oxidase